MLEADGLEIDEGKGRCRPFSIGDAMILVAATTASLYVLKSAWLNHYEELYRYAIPSIARKTSLCLWIMVTFAIPWTLAWLILRLRQPRPARRRLLQQPGMAACLSASITMFLGANWCLAVKLIGQDQSLVLILPFELARHSGEAVLATWVVLACGGSLRREPGWIDASGLALGSFWVARTLVYQVCTIDDYFN